MCKNCTNDDTDSRNSDNCPQFLSIKLWEQFAGLHDNEKSGAHANEEKQFDCNSNHWPSKETDEYPHTNFNCSLNILWNILVLQICNIFFNILHINSKLLCWIW